MTDLRESMSRDRICSDCFELKTAENFTIRKRYVYVTVKVLNNFLKKKKKLLSSRSSVCKKCMTLRTKKWVEKNKERYKKYAKTYMKKKRILTKTAKLCQDF